MTEKSDTIQDDDAIFEELEREQDAELEHIREQRIKELQKELASRGGQDEDDRFGYYQEISHEKEFMDITTETKRVVGHFFHEDFRRSKIMDTHLEQLARKHPEVRFIKINVLNAPFLVARLNIRVLPCVIGWTDAYAQLKIVGFDDLGGTDDFSTKLLEQKFVDAGVFKSRDQLEGTKPKGSIFQTNTQSDDDDDNYDL